MKISIRMDDITPDMDWKKFRFFQELLDKNKITPLLGIVPDNKDNDLKKDIPHKDFFENVRQLERKGYCIAMHGCDHLYCTDKGGLFPLNKFSEFAGLSYDEQYRKLEHGKRILEENGIVTDIFMAPAHSYDKNTLRALKALGFTKITDGFGNRPYIYEGITFYPISFKLSHSLKKSKGYTTVVIHANTVNDEEKAFYENLFEKYGKDMISYRDYLKTESVQRGFFYSKAEYILAVIKRILVSIRG